MKKVCFLIFFMLFSIATFAQNDVPTQITATVLTNIKTKVEKEVVQFNKQLLVDDELSKALIEFKTDTFRIHRICEEMQNVDYSTPGISNAIYEMAKGYDVLLNKYYNKLLKQLKGNDKTVLIKAQRAWLAHVSLEKELIATLSKTEYSGGGTIQSNIAASQYAELIINRTEELFWYLNTAY